MLLLFLETKRKEHKVLINSIHRVGELHQPQRSIQGYMRCYYIKAGVQRWAREKSGECVTNNHCDCGRMMMMIIIRLWARRGCAFTSVHFPSLQTQLASARST
jgi:hypothetical protein